MEEKKFTFLKKYEEYKKQQEEQKKQEELKKEEQNKKFETKKTLTNKVYNDKASKKFINIVIDIIAGNASFEQERKKLIKLLEKGADIDFVETGYYLTTLAIAANNNNFEMAKFLVEKGANINATDSFNITALMNAGDSYEISKLLIEHGAKVDIETKTGSIALMYAARACNLEVVKLLIENGANINHQDQSGDTALMEAAEKGAYDIVKYLIDNGANPLLKNRWNENVLDLAKTPREEYEEEIVEYLEELVGTNGNEEDNIEQIEEENQYIF